MATPEPPIPFSVTTEWRGSSLVVRPRGELDIATVPRVREAIAREQGDPEALVLDLGELEFLDTSGMRFLLDRHQQEKLTVVRGGSAVQRIFEISGLDGELRFVDSVDEALAS